MRYEHVDDVSLHTYIGTANLPYVTLVFGARSGSPRIMIVKSDTLSSVLVVFCILSSL